MEPHARAVAFWERDAMRMNDIWRALAASSVPGYDDHRADPRTVRLIRLVSAAVLGMLMLVMAWFMLR